MADIELVIKIPKEKYDIICSMLETFPSQMKEWGLEYIKDGTLLPKGHGRLIDADKFDVIFYKHTNDDFDDGVMWLAEKIDNAPTIIEADKERYGRGIKIWQIEN